MQLGRQDTRNFRRFCLPKAECTEGGQWIGAYSMEPRVTLYGDLFYKDHMGYFDHEGSQSQPQPR